MTPLCARRDFAMPPKGGPARRAVTWRDETWRARLPLIVLDLWSQALIQDTTVFLLSEATIG